MFHYDTCSQLVKNSYKEYSSLCDRVIRARILPEKAPGSY